MHPHLPRALGEALSLVKKTNLAEATSLIQQALTGSVRGAVQSPRSAATAPQFAPPPLRRSLGETLQALRGLRIAPAPPLETEIDGCPPQTPEGGGAFTARRFTGAACPVDYMLYVPADHAARPMSLLLMLHGCTQTSRDFAGGTRMNRLADEFGLIVAYPQQPRSANTSGCWNWFDRRHQTRGSGEPAMLAALARSLAREFDIENGKTFAAGLSAGGAMADVLANLYSDVFAAVGIHSGLPYGAATDVVSAFSAMKGTPAKARTTPAAQGVACRKIIFHGGGDMTVHPSNAERIFVDARRGMTGLAESRSVSRIGSRDVTRLSVADADGRSVIEHWIVAGGGHAWFGGDARGTYVDPDGPDASQAMVRFFLRQHTPSQNLN